MREYKDASGNKRSLVNLERPQLLFDDQGEPIVLYCAAAEKDPFEGTPSFNMHFNIQAAHSANQHVIN